MINRTSKKVPNVARGCSVQTLGGLDNTLPLLNAPSRFTYVVVKVLNATLPIYFYKMRNPNLDGPVVVKALDATPPMYFYKMRNSNLDGLYVRYLVLMEGVFFFPRWRDDSLKNANERRSAWPKIIGTHISTLMDKKAARGRAQQSFKPFQLPQETRFVYDIAAMANEYASSSARWLLDGIKARIPDIDTDLKRSPGVGWKRISFVKTRYLT
jgi:hypothetical protein